MTTARTRVEIAHGTYKGYQLHKKRGIEPCDTCRTANAAHMANYRTARPDIADLHQDRAKARDRALRRLAAIHPDDMQALYQDELQRADLL
jgi:hypothetical protein